MPREVYKTREIAGLWLSKTVPYARNPQRNLGFDANFLHSYRTTIATYWEDKNAVLLTSAFHSSTTRKHQGFVRQACANALTPCFSVPCIARVESDANFAHYEGLIASARVRATNARFPHTRDAASRALDRLVEEYTQYLRLFAPAGESLLPSLPPLPPIQEGEVLFVKV